MFQDIDFSRQKQKGLIANTEQGCLDLAAVKSNTTSHLILEPDVIRLTYP